METTSWQSLKIELTFERLQELLIHTKLHNQRFQVYYLQMQYELGILMFPNCKVHEDVYELTILNVMLAMLFHELLQFHILYIYLQ